MTGHSSSQNSAPQRLVIATRASRLARWQAEHVQACLQARYPRCQVDLLEMTTRGDRILDRTLSKVGGKGLFIKELEIALLDGRADLAVHSLKDVPFELAEDFSLPVIMRRADPYDALVSNHFDRLADLPAGAVVGTSSLRREAQLRSQFPALVVRPLRGNLDTRLAKLDRGDYAAIILAAAGLKRLGLTDRIRAVLPAEQSLPAAGQGALGVEIRADRIDLAGWLESLADAETTTCTRAERAVSKALGGSCQVPLAAYALLEGEQIFLRALVAEPDGTRVLRAQARGPGSEAGAVGKQVADELLRLGAGAILARLNASA